MVKLEVHTIFIFILMFRKTANIRFIHLIVFVLLSIFLLGCGKDEIFYVTPNYSDDVDNIDFDRTITIVYSTSGDATVDGVSSDFTVTIDGNDVTIVNAGSDVVKYELSGTTTNGRLKLYSPNVQAIVLNGVNITHSNGAAINIQGQTSYPGNAKRTFIITQSGSSLTDGSSYTETPSGEDEKACVFSEGPLIFSGSAALTVTAKGNAGIVSDDYINFYTGTSLKVTSSAGHGVRGKDYIIVTDGTIDVDVSANMKKGFSSDSLICFNGGTTSINVTGGAAYDSDDKEYKGTAGVKADVAFIMTGGILTITNSGSGGKGISCDGTGTFTGGTVNVTTTGSNYGSGNNSVSAKGMKFDGNLVFGGSTVTVNCTAHEAIESKGTIDIIGGIVYSYSAADDAINSGSTFTISGGYVYAQAVKNDGLDANGDFYLKGGVIYAIGAQSPEVAVDALEKCTLNVEGGTIIAIGGLEQGASLTQSCYQASSWSADKWYALTIGSTIYTFKTPSSGGTPLVVSGASTPTLTYGVSYSGGTSYFNGIMYIDASVSGGTSVTLNSYSGGSGGGGGGGNPPSGGGGGGGNPPSGH